jgi:hypothetical protein
MFRMSDGRMFTDYSNRCAQHNAAKRGNQLTSHNMRQWYVQNASKLMQESRENAVNAGACKSCFSNDVQGTMLPELHKTRCNTNYCEFINNDPNGLGLGVGGN